MKKGSDRFSIAGTPLYPHIKLTRELFPRVLITRITENDNAEYFGAFLNRTNARILIDRLNVLFRLRSCEIEIDESFNYPCTMHYKGRCVAPCVADLCGESEYGMLVGLVRSFLKDDREALREAIAAKIEAASHVLDYEAAAKWRDVLAGVEAYWADTQHSVFQDGISDTIHAEESERGLDIFLISQKGRRVLGTRTFSFKGATMADAPEAISELLPQFYRFHAPKQIRVPVVLPNRRELETELSSRAGRPVKIVRVAESDRTVTAARAAARTAGELEIERMRIVASAPELFAEMKRTFGPRRTPKKIIAIDVSHISGQDQVAAAVGWKNGRMDPASSRTGVSSASGELEALREFVRAIVAEIADAENTLILIDGGRPQLAAAMSNERPANVSMIAAVKPRQDHEKISHFITENDLCVDFDMGLQSHLLLLRLRDEAHDLANAVHRDTRDLDNFYRVAEILPSVTETERRRLLVDTGSIGGVLRASAQRLIDILGRERAAIADRDLARYRARDFVPIRPLVIPSRLQAENGAAEDLRPIETRHRRRP